jgi:hypothetical protein
VNGKSSIVICIGTFGSVSKNFIVVKDGPVRVAAGMESDAAIVACPVAARVEHYRDREILNRSLVVAQSEVHLATLVVCICAHRGCFVAIIDDALARRKLLEQVVGRAIGEITVANTEQAAGKKRNEIEQN